MRLIFMATGDIALPAFQHLLDHGPRPLALVTQPDKPVGRRQVMTPPRIKVLAAEAGVPVLQPETVGEIAGELAAMVPDVIVVFAYGQILRENVLGLARLAIINLHASLLPKYRGAACIQAAIDAGDAVTGMTAQHVVRKLDAGDLIHAETTAIEAGDTGGSLHDRLAQLAVPTLEKTLRGLADGSATRTPQDEAAASYVGKMGRDDGHLDWSMTAVELERRIRAYDPWPGTFAWVTDGGKVGRLKIFPPTLPVDSTASPGEVRIDDGRLLVGTAVGALQLFCLQPEGGRRMTVDEYLCGRMPESMG